MIRLYDDGLSADCYKVRLLMGFLGLAGERVGLDVYPGREQDSAWFRAIDPLGEPPVIDEDGFVLRDAQAILVYLAARHDPNGRWYPAGDPASAGRIAQWLGFAAALKQTAAAARLHDALFRPCDIGAARAGAHRLFRVLDAHLWFGEQAGMDWLCSAGHPTIADIACFPDVMLSEEGDITRLPYPAIRRWTDRVKLIPKFTPMPGIFGADAAAL
jgi:glutathione S-transferase